METKVAVFTPTNRWGGLDITISSLKKQTHPYTWVVADEYLQERILVYEDQEMIECTIFVDCDRQPGNKRALAQAYNNAAEFVIDFDFDLMVSLQDYIWIPDNGIEMFVEVFKKYPECLLTGLVSLSEAPGDEDIADRSGRYTIFKEPLVDMPKGISWHDVRGTNLYADTNPVTSCAAEHWEANWAAIPVELLRKGARWDLEYDEGIAYENIDFSKRCQTEFKTPCILDKRNHAISIPHREIWPEEREQLERYTNRYRHENKWK